MIRLWICRSGFLALILLLNGCLSNVGSPVSDAGRHTDASGDTHRVQQGETLYSIAWRHALDYRRLAKINNILPPYTIYVNQVIDLGTPSTTPGATLAPAARPQAPPKKVVKKVASIPQSRETDIIWAWPIEGEVVGRFSTGGRINKGIDIHGKPGQTVATAADGVVVYAGGGLRGYGKLVIVKHDDHYLSAYGRNHRLLVKEGQSVRRGQKVAEVGIGTDQDTLHFEIRRDGKPENPLRHLPGR